MLEFQYEARERAGTRVAGTLTAATERDVMQALEDRGLLPIKIRAVPPATWFEPVCTICHFFRSNPNGPTSRPACIRGRLNRIAQDEILGY